MRRYEYLWLDVFADQAFAGNPLCVFLDGQGLSDAEMQALARETNLSETTFVWPPTQAGASYRNRIFTPGGELAFAGHPTLGAAAAWVAAGKAAGPALVQETRSGLTRVEVQGDLVIMEAPAATFAPAPPDPAAVAAALGLTPADVLVDGMRPEVISAGVRHMVVPLASAETLAAVRPDTVALTALSRQLGVIGAYLVALLPGGGAGEAPLARARLFAPAYGIPEDPATGSAAAPLGAYLHRYERLGGGPAFWYEQGVEMGRPSRLWVEVTEVGERLRIRVGGRVKLLGRGEFALDS